eukprot:755948-Hanusia_phi.AAC.1
MLLQFADVIIPFGGRNIAAIQVASSPSSTFLLLFLLLKTHSSSSSSSLFPSSSSLYFPQLPPLLPLPLLPSSPPLLYPCLYSCSDCCLPPPPSHVLGRPPTQMRRVWEVSWRGGSEATERPAGSDSPIRAMSPVLEGTPIYHVR